MGAVAILNVVLSIVPIILANKQRIKANDFNSLIKEL
jgi:hypothetical protein